MPTPTIEHVEVFCHRVPISAPVSTSFGIMTSRPGVFVRLTDSDGAFGWGEIFANWPAAGAEHRARLLIEDISDLVLGQRPEAPGDLWHHLDRATRIRALQCGEWGPFAHVLAGLDTAMHDMDARRAGLALWRHLAADGDAPGPARVPAYASGIHVADGTRTLPRERARGHRAFKVKIGFDASEPALLETLCGMLEPGESLMTDANQAWTLDEALAFGEATAGLPLRWLEEPIAADSPDEHWQRLSRAIPHPLAAGENIAGAADFAAATASGTLAVIQPDVAKWGGVTGCLIAGRAAVAAGHSYCPHFLGGGIGLLASAHLLAAVGGPGALEMDVNPNPLRDAFPGADPVPVEGAVALSDAPGLGIEALPPEIARYRTLALSRSRSQAGT
ncbi:mandelate racemase [Brevirhabdus pacifica]|uniref:Mandelate racemase n=2 Tax=Brevirhabdus pacifica TaxID=1267768 RepID=A0A1U7DEW9_9RHOB|nr:mandelate racemase/muconate lactonizing enzyme family protein [Brevirhabdus pacifica]APX88428.1 mandelate racemase [Brevirhabdus pacifica]OWU79736.1 mandelate racemase [Loktanella sp. 22II-4b]PJJ87108.1 L-alanine-DL-glutamate epimerase-like enolase superfamily enzyme [Brevirhabdus pacifica]